MANKKKKISIRNIISILTLIIVIVVVYKNIGLITEAINHLCETNIFIILLLIPEQLLMYYSLGQMFFSYMSAKKNAKKISPWSLARISFELNFVNHVVPSGGVAGLGYISWRLLPYGSSPGQTSFMYLLRYAITIIVNQLQTIIAVIALLIIGNIPDDAWWVIWLALLVCAGIIGAIFLVIAIASSRKRIDWFAKTSTKFMDFVVNKITFGKRKHAIKFDTVQKFFAELHHDLIIARRNKKLLVKPILWGVLYGFLEFATFWIVGISMGHPEILPYVMIGVALASVVGSVMPTPGGVGGYEGVMILVMSALGMEVGLSTAIVVTTRVIVLVGTIASGYGFYQHAISKLGRPKSNQPEVNKGASS